MMSAPEEWQQQLDRRLDDIRRRGAQLSESLAGVRGRGEVRGVVVDVDASGEIVNLQIAPAAMRWSSIQMAQAIQDCHRKARAAMAARVEQVLHTADPDLRDPLEQIRRATTLAPPTPHRPMTDEEIQAADDAYFERMNRLGWNS
ncbi:hypothetical protein [Nocardia wallacei]|uniref:hypothetical protein n=1 Tax=Nocardia wallacei TaxID=480035 RepID=UPI0024554995|nr:hypothetical protein [Nocardia wallacei]